MKMPKVAVSNDKPSAAIALTRPTQEHEHESLPKVVVCTETAASTAVLAPHAIALSNALGFKLELIHVIEPRAASQIPFDPIEWDLRRREAAAFVAGLSKQYEAQKRNILTRVLQGRTSDQICACLVDNLEDIVALCRSDIELPGHIGQTARRVLENAANSVLMVPASADKEVIVNYQRILVPLDGSARAECALPLAKKIAQASNGKIILVHAIPEPVLTEIDPLNNEDVELRDSLLRRNERVAKDYIGRIQDNMSADGLVASSAILAGGDSRRLLNEAIINESADLLILSSHGCGGHADVAAGDVTSYLLANASVPILMIRRPGQNGYGGNQHFYRSADSKGARRPTGAN